VRFLIRGVVSTPACSVAKESKVIKSGGAGGIGVALGGLIELALAGPCACLSVRGSHLARVVMEKVYSIRLF
jgi:hypothetical protein